MLPVIQTPPSISSINILIGVTKALGIFLKTKRKKFLVCDFRSGVLVMIYCVDLDGTLITYDMSVISFLRTVKPNLKLWPKCLFWYLTGGRAKYALGYTNNLENKRPKLEPKHRQIL